MYAQLACDKILCYIICIWPVEIHMHRDTILDIIAVLLKAGADLDRRLDLVVWCKRNCESTEPELRVMDIMLHSNYSFVPLDHLMNLWRPLYSNLVPFDYTGDFHLTHLDVLLEVGVSFAIKCAMVRHFGQGEDCLALVGREGHPHQCRVVRINSVRVGPEEEDNEDLSRLTSLLANGLIEDPYGDRRIFYLAQSLQKRGLRDSRTQSIEYSDRSGGSEDLA